MSIEELYNILLYDKPSDMLLAREEELFSLIPELYICKGFKQNNEWHIYDVYNHTLCVIDNVPKNIVLRLAALFHDIGKPLSYTEDENGVGHFYGHWIESKKIFDLFADKYKINKEEANLISNLIYYHDKSILKTDDKELYEIFGKDGTKLLFQLKRADLLAQNKKYHYILQKYDESEKELLKKYKVYVNKM